jgi:hypothetical protein
MPEDDSNFHQSSSVTSSFFHGKLVLQPITMLIVQSSLTPRIGQAFLGEVGGTASFSIGTTRRKRKVFGALHAFQARRAYIARDHLKRSSDRS